MLQETSPRGFMKAEKIRNLTDEELRHQEQEMSDQLFKLKFQMNMGQTESLKKLRVLRKDIARVKTVAHERVAAGEKKRWRKRKLPAAAKKQSARWFRTAAIRRVESR